VIIDYLQLVRCDGQDNRTEEIAKVAREFQCQAIDLDICVVALSQFSRIKGEKSTKGGLEDLKGSSEIEQSADFAAMLHRDSRMDNLEVLELDASKNRNGPTGSWLLAHHRGTFRLQSLERGMKKP
jgi:replicative DNA helicase